ncbi:sigma-70 family RNA polymerase sigma factor [Nocardia sp. NPDC050712]|uniref:sigma-70 family RNA polymerase sigma factor n=1 Tax=Nocardia sp. NPDC050712 TaxID=3155518 RepID=UPI0033F0193E
MADLQRFHTVSSDHADVNVDERPAGPVDRRATALDATRRLKELLSATADGDRDAFTQLYRATQSRVFGLALRIVRQHAAAEEVTQEVYLHVWKAAGQYDERLASPIGWIMMLAHRRSVDHVRVESRSTTRDFAYGLRDLGRDHDVVAETVRQRAEERAVIDGLQTLTTAQRQTLALAYYGGRTYPEVAEYLGIPLPTVKSRIRNALKRLQTTLP